jgi:hypothetical protein
MKVAAFYSIISKCIFVNSIVNLLEIRTSIGFERMKVKVSLVGCN